MNTILKRNLVIATLMSVLFGMSSQVLAGGVSSTEAGQATMAKFMRSLAMYVTWPNSSFADDASPYKYCLMGGSPVKAALTDKLTKKVNKRGFEIVELGIDAIEESKSCHLVLVNVADSAEARPIIDALAGLPILITGESEKFAAHGGMIGFIGAGEKVGLEINKGRLDKSNLQASSKLFRVVHSK